MTDSRTDIDGYAVRLAGRPGAGLQAAVRGAGLTVVPQGRQVVTVAAGRLVEEALDAAPDPSACGPGGLLIVADVFSADGVRRAVRCGVRTMLPGDGITPQRLSAALRSAGRGEGLLPHAALVKLLGTPVAGVRRSPACPLTGRQAQILKMIAEGLGNTAIARDLSCSPHTVKNVIYDLMAQLHAGNRAHAVARGIRAGII